MPRSYFPGLRALGISLLCALALAGAGPAQAGTIVFFGDSLTAGYGLEDPGAEAYPALIQARINRAGLPWRVVNAGLSGETTAGGLRRVDWVLRQPVDVFVLALGSNDGLRGLPPGLMEANLRAIVAKVRAARPGAVVVLAGMRLPPSMGEEYSGQFHQAFLTIAREEKLPLIPFLLAGVGGIPGLNQADGLHPNPAGHAIVADSVWAVVGPLLTATP